MTPNLFVPAHTQEDDLRFIICRSETDGSRIISGSKSSFRAWNQEQLLYVTSLQALLEQPGSWLAWRAGPQQPWQTLFLDQRGPMVYLPASAADNPQAQIQLIEYDAEQQSYRLAYANQPEQATSESTLLTLVSQAPHEYIPLLTRPGSWRAVWDASNEEWHSAAMRAGELSITLSKTVHSGSSLISRVWYDQPLQGYFGATDAERAFELTAFTHVLLLSELLAREPGLAAFFGLTGVWTAIRDDPEQAWQLVQDDTGTPLIELAPEIAAGLTTITTISSREEGGDYNGYASGAPIQSTAQLNSWPYEFQDTSVSLGLLRGREPSLAKLLGIQGEWRATRQGPDTDWLIQTGWQPDITEHRWNTGCAIFIMASIVLGLLMIQQSALSVGLALAAIVIGVLQLVWLLGLDKSTTRSLGSASGVVALGLVLALSIVLGPDAAVISVSGWILGIMLAISLYHRAQS